MNQSPGSPILSHSVLQMFKHDHTVAIQLITSKNNFYVYSVYPTSQYSGIGKSHVLDSLSSPEEKIV